MASRTAKNAPSGFFKPDKLEKPATSGEQKTSQPRPSDLERLKTKTKKVKRTRRGITSPPARGPSPNSFLTPDPLPVEQGINSNYDDFSSVDIPSSEEGTGISKYDVVDFLFGGEMAVAGVKYDTEGLAFDWEVAKQTWSEQPMWLNLLNTTSLFGTILFPALYAAPRNALKFSTIATRLGKGVSHGEEVKRFKDLGMIEKGFKSSEMTNAKLRFLRQHEYNTNRYNALATRINKSRMDPDSLTTMEKIRLQFDKRFANLHMKSASAIEDGSDVREIYHKNLDSLWKSEDMGRILVDLPDDAVGNDITKYWMHKNFPGVAPAVNLAAKDKTWANFLYNAGVKNQERNLKSGLITQETVDRVGKFHFPAQTKGTPSPSFEASRPILIPIRGKKPVGRPGALVEKQVPRKGLGRLLGKTKTVIEPEAGETYIALKMMQFPRLDFPTLKTRTSDYPEILRRIDADQLITSPADMTVNGYVTDRLITNNYEFIRDIAMDTGTAGRAAYSIPAFDIMQKYGSVAAAEKAGLVSLDRVGHGIGKTIRRMMEMHPTNPGVNLGKDGALPFVRKAVFDDMFGEMGIFGQAQMATTMLQLMTAIHKTAKTALSIPTHFQNGVGNMVMLNQAGFNIITPRNMKITQQMGRAFGKIAEMHQAGKAAGRSTKEILDQSKINLGNIVIDGKKFNLNEELLDPMVRDLVEESAFETVEGFASVENMAKTLREEQRMTKGMLNGLLKMKSFAQMGDKEGFRWFDQMTKWYLAEDMVPKMGYYMSLRANGLTKKAAALEVGRRLPMYSTVGSSIRLGRRFAFPWATFPTEAMRITKNNLMDHPIRMMPWLRMPQIMQTMLSAAGEAPSTADETQEARRMLPLWAQKPESVVASGKAVAGAGGAFLGATAGAVAGTLAGGAKGGIGGAVAGGVLGSKVMSSMMHDEEGEQVRGVILDWLPHSSFLVSSNSPDFGGAGGEPVQKFRQIAEQIPAEPLALLKPIVDAISGKTAWGTELGGEDVGDQFGKALSGLIGFMSPPFVQKYGLKVTTPDIAISQQLLAREEPLPGDITNMSRYLIDRGQATDINTGRPGNLSLDFFMNNLGMAKSFLGTPEIRLANEAMTDANMAQVRTYLARQLDHHLQNGNDLQATRQLHGIMRTFSRQYADNPAKANQSYIDWVTARTKSIGKHPKLRNYSSDEIQERIIKIGKFSSKERTRTRAAITDALKQEYRVRQLNKAGRRKGRASGRKGRA